MRARNSIAVLLGVAILFSPRIASAEGDDYLGSPGLDEPAAEEKKKLAEKQANAKKIAEGLNTAKEILADVSKKEEESTAISARSEAVTPPAPPEERKKAALDLIKQGDVEGAREEVALALKAAPEDPQLVALSHLLAPAKTSADAAKLKAKALSLMEARAPETLGQNTIQASPMAWNQAPAAGRAEALKSLFTAPPGAAQRLPPEGLRKMRLGDFGGAEKELSKKIKEDPNNWLAHRFRALARRSQKNFKGAYDDATKAVTLNPKDAPGFEVRALTLIDLSRAQEALADANRALALEPRSARALAARAVAHGKLGNSDAQLADLKEAAAWDPGFDGLYREALLSSGQLSAQKRGLGAKALPYAAAALGLTLFAFAIFNLVRLGDTTARAMRAADRQAPGQPLGFKIVRQIGRGGMGVVYEAVDEALQRTVALKRMLPEIADVPRERRRFLREARTVAALRHPNIVEIYSVLEQDAGLFLVFEHVAGEDLGARLSERRKLPINEALSFSRQIAAALDYAHGQNVIHQDLKPSNIMISGGTAKVMDFGIARRAQETLTTVSRSEVIGTPAFMAPEHERGNPCPQSDLFSLAVCSYELLSGKTPFAGYQQKIDSAYEPLSRAAGLPSRVDPVFSSALNPDPAARQPSASAFVAALEAALS